MGAAASLSSFVITPDADPSVVVLVVVSSVVVLRVVLNGSNGAVIAEVAVDVVEVDEGCTGIERVDGSNVVVAIVVEVEEGETVSLFVVLEYSCD